ncbi:NTF2-related export [Brachionus plicatilis]|uniref:NTF2-related export protein n=1 Tax=Brachionus plicatilis TaxID=10195 RepID=A0A3M7T2J1_BRAPC|nr:NTF2-related export [Brachionus plicatilis]
MASAVTDSNNDLERVREISKMANEYGSEFVNKFYTTLDNKRHELGKYYADDAKIIWNGNEIDIQNRQNFQVELADCTHSIECFDVHPIFNDFNQTGHYMILVSVSGSVKYKGHEPKLFYQNFILKAIETKWKIASDCYRFAE